MASNFADVQDVYRAKKVRQEDVKALQVWMDSQPHLPTISDDQVAIFHHSCYYSNEATKTCIDNYYTCRALCPELFANRDPTSNELTAAFKNVCSLIFKKPTNEGYRTFYGKLKTYNAEHFFLHTEIKIIDMIISLIHHQEGSMPGLMIIFDMHGFQFGHLLKLNPLILKKFIYYLQIVLHEPKSDTIFKYVPKESFPDEFGGKAGPETQLHGEQIENFKTNKDFFINEESEIADESKREGRPKNAGDLFGVEGTFKKLDID